jgi:hypothetical protein
MSELSIPIKQFEKLLSFGNKIYDEGWILNCYVSRIGIEIRISKGTFHSQKAVPLIEAASANFDILLFVAQECHRDLIRYIEERADQ